METNVTDPQPDLLTCREVGRRLSMTPQSVWRLAREGKIPSVRVGEHGHRRIPAAYVDKLVGGAHEKVSD